MGNKKISQWKQLAFYSVVLSILYFGLSWSGEATENQPLAELVKIVDVIEKHDIELKNWNLYTRKHVSSMNKDADFQSEWQLIKEKTTDFQWEPLTDDPLKKQIKAVATYDDHVLNVTEKLTYIVYPHNEQLHSYLIYDVQGMTKISEKDEQVVSKRVQSRLQDLFEDNTKIFTCVSGIANDKLKFGLSKQADALLSEFSAETIEFLKEETFISISAYTTTWNNAIQTNKHNMNLQLAIRANEGLGGNTTVIIGTPIITTEY